MVSTELLVGSCLCGAVRYQATAGQVPMWYCHCQHCRKAGGAAFASWIAAAEDQFQWLSGKEKIVCYSSSSCLQRCFCSCCGTVLPARDTANSMRWLPAGYPLAACEVSWACGLNITSMQNQKRPGLASTMACPVMPLPGSRATRLLPPLR